MRFETTSLSDQPSLLPYSGLNDSLDQALSTFPGIVFIVSILLFLSMSLSHAADNAADDADEEMLSLENHVVVETAKPDSRADLERQVGFITVFDVEQVRFSLTDAAEVLEQSVGVTVKDYGGLGMFSLVSIRGSESNQVAVYLNGVPLSPALHGTTNIATIPLASLETVVVYRGWVPLSLGPPLPGGAINFITRQGQDENHGHVSLALGSFSTWKADVGLQGGSDRESFLLGFSHLSSEGDFSYQSDNGTSTNRDDDTTVVRRNGAFDASDGLVSWQRIMSDTFTLSLTTTGSLRDQGIPGSGTKQTYHTHLDTTGFMIMLSGLTHGLVADSLTAGVSLYYAMNRDLFSDPQREISFHSTRSDSLIHRGGFDLHMSSDFWSGHTVSFAAGGCREDNAIQMETIGLFSSGSTTSQRVSTFASLEDEFFLFSDMLTVRPGIRVDSVLNLHKPVDQESVYLNNEQSERNWTYASPQCGFKVQALSSLALKASVGLYSRFPTLQELYGDRGTTVGDADLDPERGLNRDCGFLFSHESDKGLRFQLEYAYFHKESEDMIAYVQNSQFTFQPRNIGKARIRGHELRVLSSVANLFSFSMGYTNQDSRDRSEVPYYRNRFLPNRPVHDLDMHLAFTIMPVTFSYSLIYESDNYLDRANHYNVPERVIHTASIEWKNVPAHFQWSLEFKNITDNHIEDVAGYPLPGRSVNASVRYIF